MLLTRNILKIFETAVSNIINIRTSKITRDLKAFIPSHGLCDHRLEVKLLGVLRGLGLEPRSGTQLI